MVASHRRLVESLLGVQRVKENHRRRTRLPFIPGWYPSGMYITRSPVTTFVGCALERSFGLLCFFTRSMSLSLDECGN